MTRLPVLSLGLLSAAALAYELLLMRLFSIIHWHHFAYMVIGLALLGHAFSGSVVTVLQRRLRERFQGVYLFLIVSFALFALSNFQWAQSIPFNAEEILWDWRQSLYLLLIFLLLSVPFFFVGAAICLAFLCYKRGVALLYAADLFGAGLGCLGFVALLYAAMPGVALFYIASAALLAAAIACFELRMARWSLLAALAMFALVQWSGNGMPLRISPYKSLPQTLLINGMRVVAETSGPLGMITVLAADRVPFRYAPGMSLATGSEPLQQLAVFTDADNMTVITRHPERIEQLSYLDQVTSALPYHLRRIDDVLIIGSGGGNDVWQARFHGAGDIEAVELNPQMVALTALREGDFVSDVYQEPGVSVHIADGRDFLNTHRHQFGLIQLNLLDSFNAAAAGLYALNENYLYTVEALRLYLAHLRPNGYLSITRWVKMPPRDNLKLFNTALTVLKEQGDDPRGRLILIRGWQTATLIVKNGPFTDLEIAAAEAFSGQRNFDLVYTPTISPDQANRFNVLKDPLFYRATQALLGEGRDSFVSRYKFNLQPADDNRPFFQHFFRWSSLPEMIGLLDKGGASLVESGYLVVFATLCIAIVSSIVLIFGPLALLPGRVSEGGRGGIKRTHVVGYFFAIGLAFLFIEIAFMQKFILFLHHPVYSASAILTAFLVFAGFGSACSARLAIYRGRHAAMIGAAGAIVLLSLSYLALFPPLFAGCGGMPMTLRFVLAILLIAPLAFFMGMPMPLALASLADHCDGLIPWAWAINGCASVVSSVLATLLAMQFGFSMVIVAAMVLYGAVCMLFPAPRGAYA